MSDFESVLQTELHWYLRGSFFISNRLHLPEGPTLTSAGEKYYAVDTIPGLKLSVNKQQLLMALSLPPKNYGTTTINELERQSTPLTASEPTVFLNHDLQYQMEGRQNTLSGVLEGGFSSNYGVLTSEFTAMSRIQGIKMTRISTTFSRDFPDSLSTLSLGDSVTSNELWGRAVYFAGVRYSSKFDTQPSFVADALPGISGEAIQPSVVDVYVNNVKQLSQNVDAGPFAIRNIPVMTDQGQIQMVVTDALGRSQTVTEQFVKSESLLRSGVSDFSYEAGTFRTEYGTASGRYRSLFLTGSKRKGITDSLTLGVRTELTPGHESVGTSAMYGIKWLGSIGGGVALSLNKTHAGALTYGTFSHTARSLTVSSYYEQADAGFWQIGLLPAEQKGRELFQENANYAIGRFITAGVGFVRENLHGSDDIQALTGTVGVRIRSAYLNVTPTYSTAPRRTTGVSFSLVIPLKGRITSYSTAGMGNAGRFTTTELDKTLPVGDGYGYRIRTNAMNQGMVDADLSYQNNTGQWELEGNQNGGSTNWRFDERGSTVWLHNHVMQSRWLQDSFAFIDIPEQSGVEVYANNQPIARTNDEGIAVVPWLVPYDRNTIHIDDSSIGMDASLETTDRVVIPVAHSGVYLKFVAKPLSGGATVILKTAENEFVPVGAQVKSSTETALVMLRGEVFLSALKAQEHLHVSWDGHACDVAVAKSPSAILPKIGPFLCLDSK